jgi:hypothetical protein
MLEQQPTFMARKNPGTGWRVDILWPDGETEVVATPPPTEARALASKGFSGQ